MPATTVFSSISPGSLLVLIGPNGFGKTTYLNELKEKLKKSGESVFFMPSEIKLMDEVRDSVETSQTMEYLLTELIETPNFVKHRDALYDEADKLISDSIADLNTMVDDVLSYNGTSRSGDFVTPNNRRFIKSLISINQKDIQKNMGSGQKMQLLLKFASKSSRDHIFLDEPEKYSHPSLLNATACAINDLVSAGKHVYIATHSPKLISMLDIDYADVRLINDSSHTPKEIPFDDAVSKAAKHLIVDSLRDQHKRYYTSGRSLSDSIKKRHNRQFIEALFSRRIYLCEGANDEFLINAALQEHGGYYGDYSILKVWGKANIPVFAYLFDLLGIETVVLFDVDDEKKSFHKDANNAIRSLPSSVKYLEQNPNLEVEIGYGGDKGDALAFMDYLEANPPNSKFNLAAL